MSLPRWWSGVGITQHLAVGVAVGLVCRLGHAASWVPVVLLLGLGVWHEWIDGDFRRSEGGPSNGIVDVLAFVLGPLLWWLVGR